MSVLKGSWKWVLLVSVFVVVVVVLVVVFFGVFSGDEDTGVFGDAEYDVFLSMGESSPGMVDLTGGSLEVVGGRLVVGFSTREPVVGLGEGEFASYDVLLILENDTGVIRSYEFLVGVNSTGRFSSLTDVDFGVEVGHELVVDQNGVSVSVDVGGGDVPTIVEWSVASSYERLSGEELVIYALDFAPDEGVYTTFLGEEAEE
jgi:hypothetical protein